MDGVDIDWEAEKSVSDFYILAQTIRTTLDKTGRKYLLTVAPASGVDGNYKNLKDIVDYVNLMSYGDVDLNNYPSYNFPKSKLLGGIHSYDGDGAPDESNAIINEKASVVRSKGWAGLFEYNLLNDMYYNNWRITEKINDDRYSKKVVLNFSYDFVLLIYCYVYLCEQF